MRNHVFNLSDQQLARIIGAFYLIIILCGISSGMLVRENIIDWTNPLQTLDNLIAQESLFRLGFLGDLIMVVSDVMVSVLFYYLLKSVNKGIAGIAAAFRLMQSAILGGNLINLFKPVLMIQGAAGLDSVEYGNLANDIIIQLQVFENGYLISGVFFAINCLLMGFLLYKSSFFPKFLGYMLGLAGLGYLFDCMANFIAPTLTEISAMVMLFTAVIAELTFCLYLLIKGLK